MTRREIIPAVASATTARAISASLRGRARTISAACCAPTTAPRWCTATTWHYWIRRNQVATGKLLQSREGKYICEVNYQFQEESGHSFWGELTTIDYVHIEDGGGYLLEIEDGPPCKCAPRKRV